MARVHLNQSPLTYIFINRGRLHFDKFFQLYAFLWVILLACIGGYAWTAVLKSIDSYRNPARRVTLKPVDDIPFPVFVFCASNTDSTAFEATSCSFSPNGPGTEPSLPCDFQSTQLSLFVADVSMQHQCLVLRGVSPTPTPAALHANSFVQSAAALQTDPPVPQTELLKGRLVANATLPSSQFQLSFTTTPENSEPFKNVLFHIMYHKTVTHSQAGRNEFVPDPSDPNPIRVPRMVGSWQHLYPARTEEIRLRLSTVTYLDETVVYKYEPSLRAVPCVEEDCPKKVSGTIRFHSLDVEDAEEEVTFDWLYVLGAIGGAMTVADVAFMVLHPALQRVIFGRSSESDPATDAEDTHRDPLLTKDL